MARSGIRLLDVQPELLAAIPAADREHAIRLLVVPAVEVLAGPFDVDAVCAEGSDRHGFGILLTDGIVMRSVTVRDRVSMDVLGAGDLLLAGIEAVEGGRIDYAVRESADVAVLDDRVLLAARRWPRLMSALLGRTQLQLDRAAIRQAVGQLPRVEHRVLAVFSELASRWGRVTPDGVLVPLSLTHDALGRMAGAARPTVTLALGTLADEGALVRRPDGAWLVAAVHAPAAAPAPVAASDVRLVPVADAAPSAPGVDSTALRERVAELSVAHAAAVKRHQALLARCGDARASRGALRRAGAAMG